MFRDRDQALRAAALFAGFIVSLLNVIWAFNASGRDFGQWGNVDPETRAWFNRQQTTPEWRERVGLSWYQFCCDHSDTVNAKFSKSGARWQYQIEGEAGWKDVPEDIVQPDVMTPGSRAILFIDKTGRNLGPVCFFPGGTGT